MKKGFTCGAFDILHAGHCLMLKEAKEHCDYLIVGLQTDPSITSSEYRGKKKNKPIQTLEERLIQLSSNKYVDEVVVYDTEEDLYEILKKIKPDIRIIGMDWKGKKYTGYDLVSEVHFNSRDHAFSSTELRERIYEAEKDKKASQ
jgi:glycerol-3-phosphate cytidylyltransferase